MTKPSIKMVVNKGVTVVREGKRVRPTIGKEFSFTAEERDGILEAAPGALSAGGDNSAEETAEEATTTSSAEKSQAAARGGKKKATANKSDDEAADEDADKDGDL